MTVFKKPSCGYCCLTSSVCHTEGAVSSGGAERASQAPPGTGTQRCCSEGQQQEQPQLSCQCSKQDHKHQWRKFKWFKLFWSHCEGVGLSCQAFVESGRSVLSSVWTVSGCLFATRFTASPHCAGTANGLTTILFSALKSLAQFAVHYTRNMLEKPFQTVSFRGSRSCWTIYGKAERRRGGFSWLTSARTHLRATERHNLNASAGKPLAPSL